MVRKTPDRRRTGGSKHRLTWVGFQTQGLCGLGVVKGRGPLGWRGEGVYDREREVE